MNIRQLAEQQALETILCNAETTTYDKFVAALDKASAGGSTWVPDKFIVWEPFEDKPAFEVREQVEEFAAIYEAFARKVLESA